MIKIWLSLESYNSTLINVEATKCNTKLFWYVHKRALEHAEIQMPNKKTLMDVIFLKTA